MPTLANIVTTLEKIRETGQVEGMTDAAHVVNLEVAFKVGDKIMSPNTFDLRRHNNGQLFLCLVHDETPYDPVKHQIALMEKGVEFGVVDGIGFVTNSGDGDVKFN